jgi:hypothetical protein
MRRDKPPTTQAEREARKEKRRLEAETSDRKISEDPFRVNMQRLRAERLAREK